VSLPTILLVEDDKMTRAMLRDSLEGHDFVILEAANAKRSLDVLEQHDVHLILLDLHLPDASGPDMIGCIKAVTNVPLLVVSGDHDEAYKITSFEMGADDYVTKPFHPDVLAARVRAHIRRFEELAAQLPKSSETCKKLRLGQNVFWTLDPQKFQVFDTQGGSAGLSAAEFRLLYFMVENASRVIKRSELSDVLFENGRPVSDRAVDIKIARIRKKIGDNAADSPEQLIQTIYGVGYMLNGGCIVPCE
jgi:two-component system OmpR family response regulator